MDTIAIPFSWLLRNLYLFVNNYGVALILFTLVVKLILLPFGMKSKKSMMKSSRLAPKMKVLEAKYKDDKVKYQNEVSKMYKEEGVNPMSGCLWSFLPLPILFALYGVIRKPLSNLMRLTAEQVTLVVTTLTSLGVTGLDASSAYGEITAASHVHQYIDKIREVVPNIINIDFSFLGLDLSQIPKWNFWFESGFFNQSAAQIWGAVGLFLIPVISGALSFLASWTSQKMNNTVIKDDEGKADESAMEAANKSMKSMLYMMPLVSVYIGFIMPAGIGIYWIASSLFSMIQDIVLTKHYRKIYDAEDAVKAERAAEREAVEAEKAARREEQRLLGAQKGSNPNTSKKKKRNIEKATEVKAPEGKLSPEEREALAMERERKKEGLISGGEPARPYARGRDYDPDRFGSLTDYEGEDDEVDYEPDSAADETNDETYMESETPAAEEPAAEPDEDLREYDEYTDDEDYEDDEDCEDYEDCEDDE